MSTGKEQAKTQEVSEQQDIEAPVVSRAIPLPPRAREELKSLLRLQNEAQERVRLVLSTLEEALSVPPGWVIRDVDEGFVNGNNLPL
jgi:hypothetical protein